MIDEFRNLHQRLGELDTNILKQVYGIDSCPSIYAILNSPEVNGRLPNCPSLGNGADQPDVIDKRYFAAYQAVQNQNWFTRYTKFCEDVLNIVIVGRRILQDAEQASAYQQWLREPEIIEQSPPDDAVRYLTQGNDHLDSGQYEAAITAFNQVIQLNPDPAIHIQAFVGRGTAHYRREQYREAIADFDRVIQRNPNFAFTYEIHRIRGRAYYAQSSYQKAIRAYTQAIQLRSDDAEVYYDRGNAYRALPNNHLAIADFTAAIRLHPSHVEAYINRGKVQYALSEYGRAIIDYDSALRLDTHNATAYEGIGDASHELGKYEKAITNYDRAIELNPDLTAAIRPKRGRAREALAETNRKPQDASSSTPQSEPYNAFGYLERGNKHLNQGNYEEAIADYNRVIQLNDNLNDVAFNGRGMAYYKLGNYREAINNYTQSVEFKLDYANAYYNRGLAFRDRGDRENAIQDFEKAHTYYGLQHNIKYQDALDQIRKLKTNSSPIDSSISNPAPSKFRSIWDYFGDLLKQLQLLTKKSQPRATSLRYAGLWLRGLAFSIDLIILGTIDLVSFFVSNFVATIAYGGSKSESSTILFWGSLIAIIIVIPWFYFALQESSLKRATFGKRIVRIQVNNLHNGRILFRQATRRFFVKSFPVLFLLFQLVKNNWSSNDWNANFPKLLTVLILLMLLVVFTKKKQALHDILAGSLVIRNS